MTFTNLSRNLPVRPGLLMLAAGALLAVLILVILLPLPLAVDAGEGGSRVHFEADRRWVLLPGDCVTLRWQAEGVREIYLDGEGVAGSGERAACPERGGAFRLRVVLPDGSARVTRLPVGILIYRVEPWLLLGAAALAFVLAVRQGALPRLQAHWRKLASAALLIGAAAAVVLAFGMASGPAAVDTASGETHIVFTADGGWLLHRCVDVHWKVEGVRAVYLDQEGVPGVGERTLCGVAQPALRVELPDGSVQTPTLNGELAWLITAAAGLALLAGGLWLPALPGRWPLAAKLALAAAVLAAPGLLVFLLVSRYLGQSLGDFLPFMADELYYWRQILTFSQAGFGGGYYTYSEAPAAAAFTHFGTWGPVFPVLFGSIGRLAGWELASGTVYNVAAITAALALFMILTRPDGPRLLAVLLTVLTAWPVLFFLPTAMQENLNQAVGIVLAGGFAVWLARRDDLPRWDGPLLGAGIFAAGLLRSTWAFLAVPFFVLGLREKTSRAVIGALAKAATLIAASFAIYGFWSAPYPLNFLTRVARLLATSPGAALAEFGQNLGFNLRTLVLPEMGTPLEVLLRAQLLFLLAGSVILGIVLWRRGRAGDLSSNPGPSPYTGRGEARDPWPEVIFHAANLGLPLIFLLLLYTFGDWRDFRTLAPHMLASVFLLIARRRVRIAFLLALASLLLLPAFLTTFYRDRMPNYVIDRQSVEDFEVAARDVLAYRDGADGWCNTVLVAPAIGFRPELAALPPELGFSVAFEAEVMPLPPRSRYLLLDQTTLELWWHGLHVEPLASLPFGVLYLNRDAACE